MTEPVVLVDWRSDTTAIVTINRPRALNALNPEVIEKLAEALAGCQREKIRHVVVTGSGDKAFVAGADISVMKNMRRGEARHFARRGQRVLHLLSRYPGVTIAAVNGFALGGGMELAMACDLIVASSNARFGQPEVGLGVIPGFGGTQRLVRLVGEQRARELILTGRRFKTDEAVRLGLAEAHQRDRQLQRVRAEPAVGGHRMLWCESQSWTQSLRGFDWQQSGGHIWPSSHFRMCP